MTNMMAAAARSTGVAAAKKQRKPYTITRPREKWAAAEHHRFLEALVLFDRDWKRIEAFAAAEHHRFLEGLVLFGRDWKRVESFVATKTATQIRSHAQKHFLRAQNLGLAVAASPRPRRAAVLVGQPPPGAVSGALGAWFPGDAVATGDEMIQLPLSLDHPHIALVYRFVGDIFGSDTPRAVEAQLQRLVGADPVIVDTILHVLGNLEDNMSFYNQPREKWAAAEHHRFLEGLVLFGRDWKRIEAFVATKTATQIRSHAQKHFLRAQKLGLAVPLPSRAGVVRHAQAQPPISCPPSWSVDDDAGLLPMVETIQLPLSPDEPDFASVYRFIGDVFCSDAPRTVEAQLQRLVGADPVIVETILRVLGNLEANMFCD
ncbi:hypothetical protein U9M48_010347, partial [Paspalum notatum var. saurae]